MVLVDSSIWIRFLSNGQPYAAELDYLLDRGQVAGHDLIEGELLIGDSGGRGEFLQWYEAYIACPPYHMKMSLPSFRDEVCMNEELVG